MNKKTKKITLLFIITMPLLLNFYWFYFEHKQEKAFKQMRLGDSLQKLLSKAGEPSYETNGTKWVEPQYERSKDKIIAGCEKEFWYKAKFFPIPSKWSYCFDKNNKLSHKYHWSFW